MEAASGVRVITWSLVRIRHWSDRAIRGAGKRARSRVAIRNSKRESWIPMVSDVAREIQSVYFTQSHQTILPMNPKLPRIICFALLMAMPFGAHGAICEWTFND